MKSLISVLLCLLLAPPLHATPCQISGDARLWAMDSCLWQFETDDVIHPRVLACETRGREIIVKSGSCAAKHIFKGRICELAREHDLTQPDPSTCMSLDRALGPSVRDGGI